jgi:hypothetical protein
MSPNTDQILSLVRAILVIVGTILTTKGIVGTADWTTYSGAIITIVPIVWSMFVHTDSAKLAAVEAMPDVAKIIVTPNAVDGAGAAAADPDRPKVTTRDFPTHRMFHVKQSAPQGLRP